MTVFGYLMLIHRHGILRFHFSVSSLVLISFLKKIYQVRNNVNVTTFPNTVKFIKNLTPIRVVYSTLFSVFENGFDKTSYRELSSRSYKRIGSYSRWCPSCMGFLIISCRNVMHTLIGMPDILSEGINRIKMVIKELSCNVRASNGKLKFIELFCV